MKGRKIFSPPGLGLRPSPNKVRDALFNILSNRVWEATFLDLYAGTGAIGIEALSRGAKFAAFVEKNKNHIQFLRKNIATCSFTDESTIFGMTVNDFLERTFKRFDLVFLDPPYKNNALEKVLIRLEEGDIMAPSGRLVVEHFHKQPLPQVIGGIRLLKEYRYGETILTFYGKQC